MYSTAFKILVEALRGLAYTIALILIVFVSMLEWEIIGSGRFTETGNLIVLGAVILVLVVCGLLYVGPIFVARFAIRLRFKLDKRSFIEKRRAAYEDGAKILPSSNSKIDAKAIRSMKYALFLRPFAWDEKLTNKLSLVPETRALAARLREHKHGHAIFQYLLARNPNLIDYSIYEEARTWADLRTLVRSVWDEPYTFHRAMSDLSFAHELKVSITMEELFGLFFLDTMPLVGLGESSFEKSSLGLAFSYSSAEQWQNDIALLLDNATFVLFVPWVSPGATWELDYLLNSSTLLKKTLLLIPNPHNFYLSDEERCELQLEYQLQRLPIRATPTPLTEDEEKEVTSIEDGVDRTHKLLLQRGFEVEENSSPLDSGGAFTVTSRGGQIYCQSLFHFGGPDWEIFDKTEDWIESVTSGGRRQAGVAFRAIHNIRLTNQAYVAILVFLLLSLAFGFHWATKFYAPEWGLIPAVLAFICAISSLSKKIRNESVVIALLCTVAYWSLLTWQFWQIAPCQSDLRQCANNEQVSKAYHNEVSEACERATVIRGVKRKPDFPSGDTFTTYFTGQDYLTNGIVIALERNARILDRSGRMVRSTVKCTYDLRRKFVLDIDFDGGGQSTSGSSDIRPPGK